MPSVDAAPEPLALEAPTISHEPLALALPEASLETLDLTETDPEGTVQAQDAPITITPLAAVAEDGNGVPAVADAGPSSPAASDSAAAVSEQQVVVEVADPLAAQEAGVEGMAFTLAPAQEDSPVAEVEVTVDYSAFADVYGGDWSDRLRLVELPQCDLEDPASDCAPASDLQSVNDPQARTVTAQMTPSSASTFAVTAEADGSTGSWSATSLSPSASWDVSEQTGTFSWSYPLRVPPAPGGPAPELALGYGSSSVDGRVASTNNQTSWVGEGWDIWSGYVERRYISCADDRTGGNNANRSTGDLCWRSDNATLMLNGSAVELVKDTATGAWKPKRDDGSRIERLTGGWGGGQNGEYWKVTTADGVQYFFGRGKRSASDTTQLNSAWNVPVSGNHPTDPCYSATFASSFCEQTWRWNLDYVLDPSGNSMTYMYEKETNNYGRNGGTAVSSYVRGGYLTRIDYGQRAGAETANAPARVEFTTAERCLPSSGMACTPGELQSSTASHWPDTPADLICTSSTSCAQQSPAFFTRKRLTTITTQVWDASSYRNVDSWTLGHQFPDPGDGNSKLLWLASIEHKGLTGTAITLPKVEFMGYPLANRVGVGDPMVRYRLSGIKSESGSTTTIGYTTHDCTPSSLPTSAQDNTRRCFPVYWSPRGATAPVQEYFHKYLVSAVVEDSSDSSSGGIQTNYTYTGDPAWHYDDNDLVQPHLRTWGEFRGYATVDVAVGDAPTAQLKTRLRFFRGMDGDRATPTGGTRSVAVDGITDHEEFNGQTRETITYNGAQEIEKVRAVPWRSAPTATGPDGATARYVRTEAEDTLTTGTTFPGGVRTTRILTSYDSVGMVTQVDDQGDVATAADDQCIRTEYARNTGLNILDRIKRVETVAKACSATTNRPGDVISDERTSYDGLAYNTAPTRGLATTVAEVSSYSGSTPVYTTVNQATYDTHGRILTATDALGRKTTTAYTPTSNGLLTQMSLTGPDPDGSGPLTAHVTQTTFDPARGTQTKIVDPNGKTTSGTYDALGRMTQVWLPGRVQGTDTPNMKYSYSVSASGTNAVTTETLIHNGTYSTSTTLYDGLMRPRQTQSPAKNRDTNDRVVTDTIYDSRGLLVRENGPWATAGAPSTTLVAPASQETLPARTLTEYDGAGRVTNEIFQVNEAERWRTITSYNGNRTSIDPPPGAIPTTTVTDARGNTTELLSYIGAGPSGTANTTRYTYDSAGRVASMTDPAGNVWTHTYDLRGREIAATDPDTGASTFTYDNADQRISSTDARGITLVTQYDQLGRKTHLRESSATGTVRATWAWDTLAKGQQTSSARIDAGNTYTSAVTGYDNGYRPLGQTTTIPASEGALAGAYTTSYTYTLDGLPLSVKYPPAGGLSSETVTTRYDNRSMPEWMGGGLGFGIYVAQSEYTPYGETAMVDLGSLYSQLVTFHYEMGTRRTETTSLQREGASGRELDITYSYDETGNVTRIADAPTGKPADVQCFTYDNQSRLNQAWTPSSGNCATTRSVTGLGGPAPYWNSYTHNTAGNRTATTTRTPTATRTASSTYPAPTAARPHAVTSINTSGTGGTTSSSFTYDNAGNTLTRAIPGQPTQTLTWDAEGRLDTLNQSTTNHDYTYTADGERLLRNQAGVKTVYLPSGQELTLTGSTVKATRYYGFGGSTVAVRTGSGSANTSSVISDHHATAEIIVNNSSNAVTRRYHDPYGVPRGTTPTAWAGDHGFLGKPTDTSGLTHIGARFYDPTQGRFLSPDPLLDRAQPQQWAAYTYANANPTTLSDPTGLAPTLNQHDGRGRQSNINRPRTSSFQQALGLKTVQPPVSIRRPPAPLTSTKAKTPSSAPKAATTKEKPKQQNLFSKWGHAALDGIGLIPGVGEIADGVNAIWYAAEGDWGNAALSAAAMIPVAGSAVVASKWAVRGANGLANVRTVSTGAESAINARNLGRQLASEDQLGQAGTVIAGSGHAVKLRDNTRLADAYGGTAAEWMKMSSTRYTGSDGFRFETHWYQNATGLRVEPKTKILPGAS